MENHEDKSEATALRQKAVELLKNKPSKHDSQLSELENHKLIFELEVHQIELELQNEELRNAQAVADAAHDKYIRLYDFAPSGYFTLSGKGEILELNLIGARLLGKDKRGLENRLFGFFCLKIQNQYSVSFLKKYFRPKAKKPARLNS